MDDADYESGLLVSTHAPLARRDSGAVCFSFHRAFTILLREQAFAEELFPLQSFVKSSCGSDSIIRETLLAAIMLLLSADTVRELFLKIRAFARFRSALLQRMKVPSGS